jgi:fatty-acyl-CoA synthase
MLSQMALEGAVRAARGVRLGQLGPVGDLPFNLRVLVRAGVLGPMRPDHLLAVGGALRRWGASPAAGIATAAIRRPDDVAVIDERGSVTFGEIDERSTALALGLRREGVGASDSVAVMCRNHSGFIEAVFACAKLGATVLLMNTDFAGPQLEGVVDRERPKALIYDAEFEELLERAGEGLVRFVSWVDEADSPGRPTTAELIASRPSGSLEPPEDPSRFVILTSGTTGLPKGAQRGSPDSLGPLAVLLSKIPLRSEGRIHVAAPMFHSWGFTHFSLGLALGSTFVLRRRFTPEGALEAVGEHRAEALAVVPVMLQRILELPPETLARYELSSLRVTAVSGSALPGNLALRWMDAFGDNLYNLYGSTEVAWASIATPEDMRAAPGTAGRLPRGTVVRIVDAQGDSVPAGRTGRIFVGNEMAFEGYTGGGGKESIGGLLSSGDVGHFDAAGRLFIDGRDDEMIVSGGENVFPREVEDLLSEHQAIDEAAVIGVDDEEFGQRLKAFVVVSAGEELSAEHVRGHVKANLARYKVPREVEFLSQLPRNPTGKVLKRELA